MKLLLKIFIFVSFVFIFFLFTFINYIENLNERKLYSVLDEKIETYNKNYANIVAKLLYDFNEEMIKISLESLYLDTEVMEIELIDKSDVINIKVVEKENKDIFYKKSILPLVFEGASLGSLEISYSKKEVLNQSQIFKEKILESTLLLMFLSLLIFYFLIYYFLNRLNILAAATDEIASGNLNYEIPIKSNDEIGQLANKFELMRKKLRDRIELFNEQLHFRQLLINAVNIPIYIKDKNLEFITCNNAYLELVGLNSSDSLSIRNSKLNDEFKKIEQEVFSKQHDLSKNLTVKNKDNDDIDIILTNNLFYDNKNELAGIVGSIFDITQINDAKKRIEKFNLELQQKVDFKTKELKLSNEELENNILELKKMQGELIEAEKMASLGGLVAGVAHEINTPIGIGLTGITHFDELLQETGEKYHDETITEEQFEEFLDSSKALSDLIRVNLTRTAQLVKSFKQISVDQSSEHKRKFNLKEYLNEIVISLNAEIKKTKLNINVKCSDNIIINSYPGVFSQLITNLILNSKIHGYDGIKKGNINIDVLDKENRLEIIYCDDGKGIEEHNLPKIFDPFFTTNRKNGGSGLGLNIIYNLVTNRLKGSIDCESKKDQGVKFRIEIPLNS